MSHAQKVAAPRQYENWSSMASESQEVGGGLASSPYAMPAFFISWIAVGVLIAVVLAARGHDARTMITLGVGLGPLMALIASDSVRRRESATTALVLESGFDHGGPLDVLVLVPGDPRDVRSVVPTLNSVRDDLGMLTLARAVAYEWVEGDANNAAVATGRSNLVEAAAALPVSGAELVLAPGNLNAIVECFRRVHPHGLVLVATAEPTASTTGAE